MAKFIALHRKLRSQTAGLEALAFEEKRSQIVKEAARAEHVEDLRSLGLVQAQPAPTQAAAEPPDRFQQLRDDVKITSRFAFTEGLPSSSILGGPCQRRSACAF